jgi:RNA polymerase sigma-70 factor, ECF subfamily
MTSGGGSVDDAADRPPRRADRLPAPDPVDLKRAEARQQEAIEFAALLGRIAQGDEAALASLYDQASARIYGLLLRMVNSPEQAAAMTQEVFVDVWRHARRYDPSEGMVFSWIVAFAHQRGMRCLAATTGESAAEPRPDPGNVSRQIDEVWAVIEQRFGSARVRAGLRALTYDQRQALLLAYFEGYSQKQIAAHLRVPLHSVRLHMVRGLDNLRRALEVADD